MHQLKEFLIYTVSFLLAIAVMGCVAAGFKIIGPDSVIPQELVVSDVAFRLSAAGDRVFCPLKDLISTESGDQCLIASEVGRHPVSIEGWWTAKSFVESQVTDKHVRVVSDNVLRRSEGRGLVIVYKVYSK